MEKKNDRNKNTSQNKLYSDEIKEMERRNSSELNQASYNAMV